MAVALRGSLTTVNATATSITVTKPTGVVAGDVIVIWLFHWASAAPSGPSGFTSLSGSLSGNQEYVAWRVADGTEGSTFTITGLNDVSLALCGAFSGAAPSGVVWDPNTPAAACSATNTDTSPTQAGLENSSSKATTNDGDMILWWVGVSDPNNTCTITAPSGFTAAQTTRSSTFHYVSGALAYLAQATHGTAGTLTGALVGSSGSRRWTANAAALKALPTFVSGTASLTVGKITTTVTSDLADWSGVAAVHAGPVTTAVTRFVVGGCARRAWLTLGAQTVYLEDLTQGYVCQSLDLGYPELREVRNNRADQDGQIDRTAYMGARVITAQVTALAGAGARIDAVAQSFAPFMAQNVRPTLHYRLDTPAAVERTLTVRGTGYQWAVAGGQTRDIHLQFLAADPVAYDPALKAATATPSTPASIVSAGQVPVRPLFRITGPITQPVVALNPPAFPPWKLAFASSFTVAAGHFVDVDTDARTVYYDGDPAQPKLSSLDWTQSSWQSVPPGTSTTMTLTGTSTSSATQVRAMWQDGYLS